MRRDYMPFVAQSKQLFRWAARTGFFRYRLPGSPFQNVRLRPIGVTRCS
jgi:hypothetical protein